MKPVRNKGKIWLNKEVRIAQTFRQITIPLPQPPGIDDPLPQFLTFWIDTRFTTAQRNRIQRIISGVVLQWEQYYFDRFELNRRSPLKVCTANYARFNLAPVWFEDKLANGNVAVDVMMEGLTRAFIANGFGKAAAQAQIMYRIPPTGTNTTIKGVDGSNPDQVPLSVTINPIRLSRTDIADDTLEGSLLHAWMHRVGYRHPTGKYTNYMIGEAAMCVMRANNEKQPGIPDSRWSAFLD